MDNRNSNQMMEDKNRKLYQFFLITFAILFGLTLIPAIIVLLGSFYLAFASSDQASLSVTVFSCLAYPLTVVFGLAAAWYFFTKKRYALIFVVMLIPLCNLLVALISNFVGY